MEPNWAEIKEAADKTGQLVADLHKKVDKSDEEGGKRSAETKEQLEKMSTDYFAMKDRMDSLETKLGRPGAGDGEPSAEENEKAHKEAFRAYLCKGEHGITAEQKQVLQQKASILGDDTNAGYASVPNDFVAGVLANIRERSPVRMFADVRSGGATAIEQVRRTGEISGAWVGETGTRSETTGHTLGLERIVAHEMYAQVHASRQMLADAAFDLESYFQTLAADAFGVLEGTGFISGNGVGQPEGIVNASGITTKTAASATELDADELLDIKYGQLKEFYRARAVWLMNRGIQSEVMQLKDGQGQYLWRPGLQPGKPDILVGSPIHEATDLASTSATTNNVALYADFAAGYRVYDRQGMAVLRDPFTSKDTGLVEIDFYRRVGGGVILPEAIVLYKMA